MTIAITANPSSKADFWPIEGIGNQVGLETCLAPRVTKTGVQPAERGRENLAQGVDHAATFRRDVGFFEKDFPSAPKPLEHDLELGTQGLALRGREHGILTGQ